MSADSTYPAFPVLAFIGVVLVLIPLPWHFQAWNSGTCLYMIWTALGLINLAINSIIWRSSVINYAPIWCDICKYMARLSISQLTFVKYSFTSPCGSWSCHTRRISMYQSTSLQNCHYQ